MFYYIFSSVLLFCHKKFGCITLKVIHYKVTSIFGMP